MKVIFASPARWNHNITFLYVVLGDSQTLRVGQSVRVPLVDGSTTRAQIGAIRPLGQRESRIYKADPGMSCELELYGVPYRAVRV